MSETTEVFGSRAVPCGTHQPEQGLADLPLSSLPVSDKACQVGGDIISDAIGEMIAMERHPDDLAARVFMAMLKVEREAKPTTSAEASEDGSGTKTPLQSPDTSSLKGLIGRATKPGQRIRTVSVGVDRPRAMEAALEAAPSLIARSEQADRLEGELRAIDSLLARRRAIDDIPDRYGKINKALHVAGRFDQTQRRAEAAEAKVSTLEERVRELEAAQVQLIRERSQ